MAHQYQKVYMNQIHSSSLLCQLSQMWKSQLLCDAHIQTGTTTTKAHRVVLVAACPMLQSMGPSETGSDLKIRLPSDIRAESVCTFLQYLYEGFTTLTDINIHEVEKIARLLQVDCLIKCCADFNKTLNREVGLPIYSQSQYKYTFHDMFEFRHVRHSDLVRLSQNRSCKRPPSGVSSEEKRPRLNDLDPRRSGVLLPSTSSQIVNDSDSHKYTVSLLNQVADDKISMAETYNNSSTQSSSQAVTSVRSDDCVIVEDEQKTFEEGIEMSEKPSRHTMQSSPAEPHVQDVGSVGVFVSCQTNMDKSVQEVNMETDNTTTSLGEETDHSSSASSAVQKCADTSTTKSSHAESKGSFPHEAPLIATVVDCPEEEPTNCAIEENCQVRSPSEKDFTPIGSPPDVEKDGPPDVPSAMPGPAETEPENPTSSQQSDDSPNSPLVESRMDHIANANNSVSPTPSDSTPDLSIIKVERVNHDGEFLGLSMHVDMEDCEDYDREDYRGDELDESRLSGLSEGGATEHGTAWFVGTFKGAVPANRKRGSPLHLADSRSRKQTHSHIKPLMNRDNTLASMTATQNSDANHFRNFDIKHCAPSNEQPVSYSSFSDTNSDRHSWKSMTEFEDKINTHFNKSHSSKVGEYNISEQRDCDITLTDEEMAGIIEIRASSYSRQNFAWRLVRFFFSEHEIKDHNCYGRKGKPSLEVTRLNKVRSLAFQYYPAANNSEESKFWRDCVVAIDKGIRNTFCDYNYGSRGRKSETWDFQLPYLE